MSLEENKAAAHRVVEELFNKGNLTAADELLATSYVDQTPLPGQTPGPEGFKEALISLRNAFPDARWSIEELVPQGEKIVLRLSVRGVHQGELLGIPPTGKNVTINGIGMYRIADGKIEQGWVRRDLRSLLRQLGVYRP